MTERSGSEPQTGSTTTGPGHRPAEETTSVFVADGQREQSAHETIHHDRPNVPLGSSAPPWQRGHQPSGSDGHDGPAHAAAGHAGSGHAATGHAAAGHVAAGHAGDHDQYRPGTVMADQPTIAEQRPSYAPPMHGNPNGAPVQNPFLVPKDRAVPPHIPPDHPIPLGGPGAIPVGGPSGPAGPAGRPPAGRPTARPSAPMRGRPVRAPRKASLQIRRFDPWSVLKLSLVLSVAMFLMWLVAVGVLYGVLDGMGVWDKLNGAYSDLASVNDETGGAEPLISAGRVFGVSAVVGVVNIVLFTAFATVSAFVYNVSADLAGGIEVTLSERD